MSRFKLLLVGLLATACLLGGSMGGLVDPTMAGSAATTQQLSHGVFDIQVRVDQATRSVIVDVFDGPINGIVLIEATITSHLNTGGSQVQTHMTLALTDANGQARSTAALNSSMLTVHSEAVIRGLYATPGMLTVFESSHWVMTGMHLNTAQDIDQHSGVALDLILGELKNMSVGLPTVIPLGVRADAPVSNVFMPDDPMCVGFGQLSCSGTWFAAGPIGMYQASTGPAGVFTAN